MQGLAGADSTGIDSDVLKTLRQADLPFQLGQDCRLEQIRARCFRLRDERGSYFMKLLDEGDPRDANELYVCRNLLGEGPCPAPRLVFAVNAGSRIIACWEWLEGHDLRRRNRHRLPHAFEVIGRFHLAKRHDDAFLGIANVSFKTRDLALSECPSGSWPSTFT